MHIHLSFCYWCRWRHDHEKYLTNLLSNLSRFVYWRPKWYGGEVIILDILKTLFLKGLDDEAQRSLYLMGERRHAPTRAQWYYWIVSEFLSYLRRYLKVYFLLRFRWNRKNTWRDSQHQDWYSCLAKHHVRWHKG